MRDVAIYIENVVIPALGAAILFKNLSLKYLPEYFEQHLSVCLPLLIKPLLSNIAVPDWNSLESDHYNPLR